MTKALGGDYQAQRNVSAAFTENSPWIEQDPVKGCAWRMVIMVTRPAEGAYDDAGMYRIQCASLDAAHLAEARDLAGVIYRQVHNAELPVLPAIPS